MNTAARGRIDLARARKHWDDILRVVASVHTGAVAAYDVVRMLQRDGSPTPFGDAIASYGRIFKSLHVLAYADDEAYRRDIKGIRNLQEGRHSLAAAIFHGKSGELYQRYYKGMEDQLGAFGLVLNCVVLWNTFYMNAALERLRALGYPAAAVDVARLSPFVRRHLNVHGKYTVALPELPAGLHELRHPDAPDDEDDVEHGSDMALLLDDRRRGGSYGAFLPKFLAEVRRVGPDQARRSIEEVEAVLGVAGDTNRAKDGASRRGPPAWRWRGASKRW